MRELAMQVVSWTIFAMVTIIMIINASWMIFAPRAWFQLPGWLRVRGTRTEERYSAGGGESQLRLGGLLVFASLGWVLAEVLQR